MAVKEWFTVTGDVGRLLGGANGVKLSGTGTLTGATVVFNMRPINANGDFQGSAKVNNAAAIIVDAADRRVTYRFQTADVDTAGTYAGEFEVTYPGGTPVTETHPNRKENQLRIVIGAEAA